MQKTSGRVISSTDDSLQEGEYEVQCESKGYSNDGITTLLTAVGEIRMTDEAFVQRLVSYDQSGRINGFRHGTRGRDGKCTVSGTVNRNAPITWSGFEAAHVFPVEQEGVWIDNDFRTWVTDASGINSLQTGLLMKGDIHKNFDNYLISINPDDSWKIISFDFDPFEVDGRVRDPVCRKLDNPHRVSLELLRWYYRQSILANMRGRGEPIWEHDFPPGCDMMGEMMAGPSPAERLELEFAARLNPEYAG